jgi:ABC-type branched-subunit amino acid transport system substrate-binding protein
LFLAAWAAIVWNRPAPIRIAFANSLTGPSGPAGLESLAATVLAVDEVNAKGIRGRPIELIPSTTRAPLRRRARTSGRSPTARELRCSDIIWARRRWLRGRATNPLASRLWPERPSSTISREATSFTFVPRRLQGRSIAEYLRAVPKVHLVNSRDRFGSSFRQGFAQAYEPRLLSISSLDIDPSGRISPVTELLDV